MSRRRAFRALGGGGLSNLLTDLVAYWKFDSNGVDSVAGKTPITSTSVNYGNAGIIGNSLEGTVSTCILRFADSDDFSFTSGSGVDLPFSVSMWVKADGLSTQRNFLFNKMGGGSGVDEWGILIGGTGAGAARGCITVTLYDQITNAALIYCRSQSVAESHEVLGLGFGHVVVTYDGSKTSAGIKIYINGVLATLTYLSPGTYTGMANSISTLGLTNAAWGPAASARHIGKIDEAGIWKNRELTASEVLALYNSGAGLTYPF